MAKKKAKGPAKALVRGVADILTGAVSIEAASPELARLGFPIDDALATQLDGLGALVQGAQGEGAEEAEAVVAGLPELGPAVTEALVEALVQGQRVHLLATIRDEAPSKYLRKGAVAGLRRLQAAGVETPEVRSAGGIFKARGTQARAAISGVDHLGRQMVYILLMDPSETRLCAVLYNEDLGVEDAAIRPSTPGSFAKDVLKPPPGSVIGMVEVGVPHALYVFERALARSLQTGRSVPYDLIQTLGTLKGAHPPASQVPPEATGAAPLTGKGSIPAYEAVIVQPEVYGWQPPRSATEVGMKKLAEVTSSPVVVSDDVHTARMEAALREGAAQYFDAEQRARWSYRLDQVALVFAQSGREALVAAAGGFARSVGDPSIPVADIPFLTDLYAGHVIMSLEEMFAGPGSGDIGEIGTEPEADGGAHPLIIPGR